MLTYSEIKAEQDAGLSLAQIVTKYSAFKATKQNIDADELQTELFRRLLIYEDITRVPPNWTGVLFAAIVATQDPTLIGGLNLLINQLKKENRKFIETTNEGYGQLLDGIMQVAIAHPDIDHVSLQTRLDELSGGLKYAGMTVETLQATIDQHERDAALQAVEERANNASEAARNASLQGQTPAQIIEAAETAWGS